MEWKHIFSYSNLFEALKHWIIQVFLVIFLALLIDSLQKRVLERIKNKLKKDDNRLCRTVIEAAQLPLTFLIWVVGIAFATEIIQSETQAIIFSAVSPLRSVSIIAILAWFLIRLLRKAEPHILESYANHGKEIDQTTADVISKILRASIIITATLVALQTLGFSISGVLAFGGIGGVAIGFAAKDLLANFFGGLMLYWDRPFKVGDWIRSCDREIEGTVESIGWRLTCIRTFEKRPLYVPNSLFSTIAVENPSRMTNRRIKETFGIRYDDVNVIETILKEVRAMLQTHPEIDQDVTLMVNLDKLGDSALEFFIYTFTRTTVWATYHEVKEDVLLKVFAIIAKHGAELAYPTSTMYLSKTSSSYYEK